MKNEKVMRRVSLVLDIARGMASKLDAKLGGYTVSNYIEEISVHTAGYGETGYTDPDCGVICSGNWNKITRWDRVEKQTRLISNLPERLGKILEKLGVDLCWSDRRRACDDCGVLLRTQADCYSWEPSYHDDGGESGEFVCLECHDANVGEEVQDEAFDSDEPTCPDDVREVFSKPAE